MGNISETIKKAEETLCTVINELSSRNDINPSDLEMLSKATGSLKDIYKVKTMGGDSYERYMDDGYGRRARDSRGRFMDDGYSRDYNAEYSNYGHSDAEEKEYIRWKMNNAKSEQEREKYRRKLEMM